MLADVYICSNIFTDKYVHTHNRIYKPLYKIHINTMDVLKSSQADQDIPRAWSEDHLRRESDSHREVSLPVSALSAMWGRGGTENYFGLTKIWPNDPALEFVLEFLRNQ